MICRTEKILCTAHFLLQKKLRERLYASTKKAQ